MALITINMDNNYNNIINFFLSRVYDSMSKVVGTLVTCNDNYARPEVVLVMQKKTKRRL